MTLKEAAPYFPVIRVKPDHTELYETLDRAPSQMTIGELHKHRFYLETEILKTGPDTCTVCKIKIGSVEIIWQIHVNHAYQAYSRLKELHAELSSQAIRMIVPAIGKWEGLSFLRQGQDMGEIGPIESSGFVRHDPYSLPQGFEWSVLDSRNFDEIIQFYKYNHPSSTYPITRNSLKWLMIHPQYKKGCFMGVRYSSSKMLTGCVGCIPCNIRVGGKLLSIVSIQRRLFEGFDKQQVWQLYSVGIKETMRMLGFEGIFQAMLFVGPYEHVLEPTITYHMYSLPLFSLPYSSPRTVGLRRMKASDVPEALTLTNQYTSQFEIGQVFQSEEEFSHWFLSPLLHNVTTYVVEDPNSGSITDMFSFETHMYESLIEVFVRALVITKTSAEQLISDILVCAKQQKVTSIGFVRFGLKEHLFKNFMVSNEEHILFYNYKHPQVGDDNFCLFCSGL